MKTNLLKVAIIAIAAGCCLSAKAAPQKKSTPIAMTQCSKSNKVAECKEGCSSTKPKDQDTPCRKQKSNKCSSSAARQKESAQPLAESDVPTQSKQIAIQKKSAARKILQGS
jgi:hypothetical protein